MADKLRITVTDEVARNALITTAPTGLHAKRGPSEDGFGETLYPILVTAGVISLPAGVIAGLIANWIGDALKARKQTPVGLEFRGKITIITLSEDDVERIADRINKLLDEGAARGETDQD